MKIDTIPSKKITAQKLEHSIFTGTKFCFVNFDREADVSWDGSNDKVNFQDKGISVLFSEKELDAFLPNNTVHNFLLDLRQSRKKEIISLKQQHRKAKTYWKHSTLSNCTCNPKQIIKDKIDFLENNEIIFVEITFK